MKRSPFVNLPLFVRKFVVDCVETGLAALLALALVIPGSLSEVEAQAGVVGVALLGAVIAAVRRAAPEFVAWLKEQLAT
jgi:hypothetical protein